MANHKVPDEKRMLSVCGTIQVDVLRRIEREAAFRGVRRANVVGEILTDWARGTPDNTLPVAPDPNQRELELDEATT